MAICIPKEYVDGVLRIVNDTNLSSVQRNKKLTDLFGDAKTAQDINLLYEKTLLLKNQGKALDKFVDDITGVSTDKKAILKENIRKNIERKKDIMSKEELDAIAKEVYDRKYKLDIDPEKVSQIARLSNEAENLKVKMQGTPDGSPERLAYGRKVVEQANIIEDIVVPTNQMGFLKTLGYESQEARKRIASQRGIVDKVTETGSIVGDVATAGLYKALNATADISMALRQGSKVFYTSPKVWLDSMQHAMRAFKGISDKQKVQAIYDNWRANLVSRELYDEMTDAKLALGVVEEYFPTHLGEKIKGWGNIVKSSDTAFTTFSQGARAGLYEKFRENLVRQGVKIDKEQAKSLAIVANSISGRGNLGKLEQMSGALNKVFFSARFVKSSIDTFTMPFNKKLTVESRKIALKNSVATFSSIGAIMYTANMFTEVEFDSRSSKFGKMKLPGSKDTWIDLTGGLGGYIVLARRIQTGEVKSATTGKISLLNVPWGEKEGLGYKPRTAFDLLIDFGTNKFAPMPSTLAQVAKGRDFSGNVPTVPSAARSLLTPISIENFFESLQDEKAVTALISTMFDILGASAANYEQYKK